MMDFIKAYPSVTKEAYLWEWTIPQIKIAMFDATRINYLDEEEANKKKAKKINSIDDLTNDFGTSIFNGK